jgi:hypothetical protein
MRCTAILGLCGLLLWPTAGYAQYVVGPTVIAGGGARLTGGSYVITATSGQAGPIGVSTGGAYRTLHGFWYAVTGGGGGALDPMVLSITLLNPSTVRFSWPAVAGATYYDIYRSMTPYFSATGPSWVTVTAPDTDVDTSVGVGDPSENFFYLGIARNASQSSPESNRVGEFDFGADIPLVGQGTPSGEQATER